MPNTQATRTFRVRYLSVYGTDLEYITTNRKDANDIPDVYTDENNVVHSVYKKRH